MGVVLAGGASRRLGGIPKGLQRIGDRRIIDRVADVLREVTPELVLSANDERAAEWLDDVPVLRDHRPGAGGLAGVEAALAGGRDALVVAWDMPFVTAALLRALVGTATAADADVVVPESASPHGFEPFCAYYAARARPAMARFLDRGGGAAHEFVRALSRVARLSRADVARVGEPLRLFFSVNTPVDLERARAMEARTE